MIRDVVFPFSKGGMVGAIIGVSSLAYLVVAAVIGCAFSLRRVLRIDPASAIGSSS